MTEKEIQELFVTHSFQDAKQTLIDECKAMGYELMGHENVFELKALALRGSRSSDGDSGAVASAPTPTGCGSGDGEDDVDDGEPCESGSAQEQSVEEPSGQGEEPKEQKSILEEYADAFEQTESANRKPRKSRKRKGETSGKQSEETQQDGGQGENSCEAQGETTAEQLDDEAKRKMAEAQDLMKQAQEMREARRRKEEEERKKREEEQNKKNKHYRTDEVVRRLKCLHKAFLVGPAGTGKSTLAMCACKELFGIDGGMEDVAKSKYFAQISFSPDTVSADMLGFTDVNGVFHETDIIRVFREGGLILFDEMDDADASLLVKLNTMLANRVIPTPSGMVVQNKDTYIVGTANTYGTGGTSMYVGRNRLDAATLDRWKMATIHVDYDVELEDRIIGDSLDEKSKTELCTARNAIRDCISANKWRQICSTRFVIDCCSMMKSGYKLNQCIDTYLLSWDENNRNVVNKRIRDDLKALSK